MKLFDYVCCLKEILDCEDFCEVVCINTYRYMSMVDACSVERLSCNEKDYDQNDELNFFN